MAFWGNLLKYLLMMFVLVGFDNPVKFQELVQVFVTLRRHQEGADAPSLACSSSLSWNLEEELLLRSTGLRVPSTRPKKTTSPHTSNLGKINWMCLLVKSKEDLRTPMC